MESYEVLEKSRTTKLLWKRQNYIFAESLVKSVVSEIVGCGCEGNILYIGICEEKQTCQDAYNDVVVTFSGGVDKLAFENCPQKYKNRQNKGACCYNLHLAT